MQESWIASAAYMMKSLWKYSRVLKWIDIISLVFWIAESGVYEFASPENADRLRLANVLPLPVWFSIAILLVAFTILEGTIGWCRNEVLPLLGMPGSLQHETLSTAARLLTFTRHFLLSNPPPSNSDLEAQWKWEGEFTRVYIADIKERVSRLSTRLAAAQLPSHGAEELASKATVDPGMVYRAARELQEIAIYLKQRP
jgi:hypothetical protein